MLLIPAAIAAAVVAAIVHSRQQQTTPDDADHGSAAPLFITYAPPGVAAPLVLDLHGLGGSPLGQRKMSGIDGIARERGMHVLWPSGYQRSWNAAHNTYPPASAEGIDHAGILMGEVRRIRRMRNVSRVILSGFSNGCAMAFRLINAAPPRTFAAILCASHHRPDFAIAAHATPTLVATGEDDPWVASVAQMNATLRALAQESHCAGGMIVNETDVETLTSFRRCDQPILSSRLKARGHGVYGEHTTMLEQIFLDEVLGAR